MNNANEAQMKYLSELDKKVAQSYDAMVQIVADANPYELKDVDIKRFMPCKRRANLFQIFCTKNVGAFLLTWLPPCSQKIFRAVGGFCF